MDMSESTRFDLKITNYKSIDKLELDGIGPFTVFAGPNGSGKSNLFDALDFFGRVIRVDVEDALRAHGGAENIRSAKRRAPHNRRLRFSMDWTLPAFAPPPEVARYDLIIDLQDDPRVEEELTHDGASLLHRPASELRVASGLTDGRAMTLPPSRSALFLFPSHPLARLLSDVTLYRIDPRFAKEPDASDTDPSNLNGRGSNLASVLGRMESDSHLRDQIAEWLKIVVPGFEGFKTQRSHIDGRIAVLFKERGTKKRFPARLMSDGTLYALSLLVAVLDRRDRDCLTLLEEPERGLHPLAIGQFIDILRETADSTRPIWVTTHSESVIRNLELVGTCSCHQERRPYGDEASFLRQARRCGHGCFRNGQGMAGQSLQRRFAMVSVASPLIEPRSIHAAPAAQYFVERVAALGL